MPTGTALGQFSSEICSRVSYERDSSQSRIPDVGGLGGGGLFRFGVALRGGNDDNAASRDLVAGIGRHLEEEVRRKRRDNRDHDESGRKVVGTQLGRMVK